MRSIVGIAALVAVFGFGFSPAIAGDTDTPSTIIYPADLPPCDEEDGTVTSNGVAVDACYWDAAVRGNGAGNSFVAVR